MSLLDKYHLSKKDSDDWRTLLGNEVLDGDISISERSRQLFGQPSVIHHLFEIYPNEQFESWYKNQGFSSKLLKAGITLNDIRDYKNLLSGVSVCQKSLELFGDRYTLGRYLSMYTDYTTDSYRPSLCGITPESFQNWRVLLGDSVLQGKQSIASRSIELFNNKSVLYYYLDKYAPADYQQWKTDYKFDVQLLRLNLTVKDFQDWKTILGPLVLTGKIYTKQRSLELGGLPADLNHCLSKYAPSDYFDWYKNQGFSPCLIRNNLCVQDLSDWKTILTKEQLNSKEPINSDILTILLLYAPKSFKIWYQEHYHYIRGFQSNYEKKLIKRYSNLGYEVGQYNHLPNGRQIDVYFPKFKIGFELDGYYFHSWGHEDGSVKMNRYYHRDKTTDALKAGIRLYHLWHNGDSCTDYDLLDSIIESKLNISPNKFSAGSFHVKEPSAAEEKAFFDENHLQGYVRSKYSWALYNQKHGIVACISFGYRNSQLELLRFACKRHCVVKYGFSKLFNFALTRLPLCNIVSYGNRDLIPDPMNSVYARHGFVLQESNPNKIPLELNYYSTKEDCGYEPGIYTRQHFSKNKLFKMFPDEQQEQSEIQIAANHGIYPCFNSGTWKYIYHRERIN